MTSINCITTKYVHDIVLWLAAATHLPHEYFWTSSNVC